MVDIGAIIDKSKPDERKKKHTFIHTTNIKDFPKELSDIFYTVKVPRVSYYNPNYLKYTTKVDFKDVDAETGELRNTHFEMMKVKLSIYALCTTNDDGFAIHFLSASDVVNLFKILDKVERDFKRDRDICYNSHDMRMEWQLATERLRISIFKFNEELILNAKKVNKRKRATPFRNKRHVSGTLGRFNATNEGEVTKQPKEISRFDKRKKPKKVLVTAKKDSYSSSEKDLVSLDEINNIIAGRA